MLLGGRWRSNAVRSAPPPEAGKDETTSMIGRRQRNSSLPSGLDQKNMFPPHNISCNFLVAPDLSQVDLHAKSNATNDTCTAFLEYVVLAVHNFNTTNDRLSRQAAFWALVPIALNTMTQPTGRILDLPSSFNFVARSSPFICLFSTFYSLGQVTFWGWREQSLKKGLQTFANTRFKDVEEPAAGTFESLRKNTVFRILLFGLGALPQIIKLYASSGILILKIVCGMYLISFAVDELLLAMSSRPEKEPPSEEPSEHLQLLIWQRIGLKVSIGLVSLASFYAMRTWTLRVPMTGSPMWMVMFFLLPLNATLLHPGSSGDLKQTSKLWVLWSGFETTACFGFHLMVVLPLEKPVFYYVFLACSTTYRLSVHVETLVQDKDRMRHASYVLAHIFAALLYLMVLYDPTTTERPSWTGLLG